MKYTMHCPIEICDYVMATESDSEDEAVKKLIAAGDKHFADAGHPVDHSITPDMTTKMPREYMIK